MSVDTSHADLDQVRADELQHILVRRQAAKLGKAEERLRERLSTTGPDAAETDLTGLALSGGGLRSACFCTGFIQSLHRWGLWRYVDYLSTVSGGGYIGGHLSSSALRDETPFDRTHFPLREEPGHEQPPNIKRLIYSGHYLFKPWLLFNKWFVGVVLINLAIFSAMLAACTLIALLWRTIDFPWFRERGALLSFGDDLMAPFWPAIFFGVAWLLAWLLSFYRRGTQAAGRAARFFLYLAVPSALIGCSLLVGNGDIAGGKLLETLFGSSTISIKPEVWGPVVALIGVGLLPFLRPRRLLQSGLRPQKKWERAVFLTASSALLVGLPLCLIGLLARENISGYNSFPHREVIRQDIAGWPTLLSTVLPHVDDQSVGEQRSTAEAVRKAWLRMGPFDPIDKSNTLEPDLSEERRRELHDLAAKEREIGWDGRDRWGYEVRSGDAKGPITSLADAILVGVVEDEATEVVDTRDVDPGVPSFNREQITAYLEQTRKRWQLDNGVATPLTGSLAVELADTPPQEASEAWKTWAEANPWPFLCLRSWELVHVSAARDRRRRDVMEIVAYYDPPSLVRPAWEYVSRVYHVLGWMCGDQNEVTRYWEAKERQEVLQEQICYLINRRLLSDRQLLKQQLTILLQPLEEEEEPNERLQEILADSPAAYDPSFSRLVQRASRAGIADLDDDDVWRLNRLLLEHSFAGVFRPRSQVRRLVSIYQDQYSRVKWLLVFTGAFLLFSWLDLNALSMHNYYRDRLVQAFLVHKAGKQQSIPLTELDTTEVGSPYHLISTTVSSPGRLSLWPKQSPRIETENAAVDERWLDSFLLSRRYCGSQVTGYLATDAYEQRLRGELNRLTLAEAIALSGAAISPGHTNNGLVTFLMLALNLRLGQWLPNPKAAPPTSQPRIFTLLAGTLRHRDERPYCFVTDGGISENLGIVQLLRRRCGLIFAVDAGHDPDHDFNDLARVIRQARIHGGVELVRLGSLPPAGPGDRELQPGALAMAPENAEEEADASPVGRTVEDHVLLARICYPGADDGLLIYVKPSFTGDEPLDLIEYRRMNPEFPHQTTTDQAYDPDQVESYRRLGYHIGERVSRLFATVREGGDFWNADLTAADLRSEILNALGGDSGEGGGTQTEPSGEQQSTAESERDDATQRLVQQLRHRLPDPSQLEAGQLSDVLESVSEFADWPPARVAAALRAAVEDRGLSPAEREFVAVCLQRLEVATPDFEDRQATAESLLKVLQSDPAESVRSAAADALGLLGRDRRLRTRIKRGLTNALQDDSPRVRSRARTAIDHLEAGARTKKPRARHAEPDADKTSHE